MPCTCEHDLVGCDCGTMVANLWTTGVHRIKKIGKDEGNKKRKLNEYGEKRMRNV